jgi:hypothetical protein
MKEILISFQQKEEGGTMKLLIWMKKGPLGVHERVGGLEWVDSADCLSHDPFLLLFLFSSL